MNSLKLHQVQPLRGGVWGKEQNSMKAIVQDTYGSPEGLELRDIDKPEIGDGEVLVRVRAASVNPGDWAIMSGLPYIARPVYGLRKPKNSVRGTDVADGRSRRHRRDAISAR